MGLFDRVTFEDGLDVAFPEIAADPFEITWQTKSIQVSEFPQRLLGHRDSAVSRHRSTQMRPTLTLHDGAGRTRPRFGPCRRERTASSRGRPLRSG